MSRFAILLAMLALTPLTTTAEKPVLTSTDLETASKLVIEFYHAGNQQGVRPARRVFGAGTEVFEVLSHAVPVEEPPQISMTTIGKGTLTIGGRRYRIIPTSEASDWRFYFSVAPEEAPNRVVYFLLGPERGERLRRFFAPP